MQRPKMWLVYQEFQADTPDIVGLFQSRRDAELAAEECRRTAREEYDWVVYGDLDQDGAEIADWSVDVHVEEHEVQPSGAVAGRGRPSEKPVGARPKPRRPQTPRTSRPAGGDAGAR